jgi:predicted metal-dependent hydrolase
MSFPVGEQFFIDSVRNGHKALSASEQPKYKAEVQGFVGQEATHRRIHALFNAHLEKHGLVNAWGPRALKRQKLMQGVNVRHWLAITAANEHFTAIFAEWMLKNSDLLDDCEPRLKTMWLWHSAEEAEHKSTAFDLYRALGGDEKWRLRWFRRITIMFLGDTLRQTVDNLRRDGTLWKWSTWKSAGAYLFGRRGLLRNSYQPWKDYLRKDFHPQQQHSDLSQRWLADNAKAYSVVAS